MTPIQDHRLRFRLANELHARPFPSFNAPASVAFLAIKKEDRAAGRDRAQDMAHLIDLLDRYGAPHPQPGATHYSGSIGRHNIKWEQHTEFVTYTVFSEAQSERPFDQAEFDMFPRDWLAAAPGVRVTSALIRVERAQKDEVILQKLRDWLVPESLACSYVLDRSAIVAGDFRVDPAGHLRFAIFADDSCGPGRIGRITQRLCEIETYKAMSMLGFFRAGEMASRIGEIEVELGRLMDEMTGESQPEKTLDDLLAVSQELEATIARSSYRFGATKAYAALVKQRIEVLREETFMARQSFGEFMMRRFDPAMRTIVASQERLNQLADRSIRASELLRTKVDVARSAQNQDLLASMDKRAQSALRLQETVEALSVVAISYYAVSLAGYLFYPMAGVLGISKSMLIAGLTVPVIALVWFMIRRIKSRLT